MKHVTIPAPLPFGQPFPFAQTVGHILDTDPVFYRPATNARVAQRLLGSLERAIATSDRVWTIDRDEDWNMLAEAAERWVGSIAFTAEGTTKELPARHFLPHLDAIAEARVNDPRPELAPLPDQAAETASAN